MSEVARSIFPDEPGDIHNVGRDSSWIHRRFIAGSSPWVTVPFTPRARLTACMVPDRMIERYDVGEMRSAALLTPVADEAWE
jgi:hypothetical protein